jgi:hypothetical protein
LCQLLETSRSNFKVKPKKHSKFINTTAYIRGFLYLHFTKRLKNEKIILLILLISSFANAQQRIKEYKASNQVVYKEETSL